jgi:Lrp/AsnC family transcriptional regulator for asnA, asnC and gidA
VVRASGGARLGETRLRIEAHMKRTIDGLDRGIIASLADDGARSAAEVAGRLGVTSPTVRTRLRSLVSRGVVTIAGLVDPVAAGGLTTAIVGLTLADYDLDEKVEALAALDDVNWAAVVTGRYDIIVEVVTAEGMTGLYDFLNVSLQEVGGISSSEVFVVMKARNRSVALPTRLRREWLDENDDGRG